MVQARNFIHVVFFTVILMTGGQVLAAPPVPNTAHTEFIILWDTRAAVRNIVTDSATDSSVSPVTLCGDVGIVTGRMASNLAYLREYAPGNIPVAVGQAIAALFSDYPPPNAALGGMSDDCTKLTKQGVSSTEISDAVKSLNLHATEYFNQLTNVVESLRPLQ